jgi:hypothetical protein
MICLSRQEIMPSISSIEEDPLTITLASKLGELHANLLPPLNSSRNQLLNQAEDLEKALKDFIKQLQLSQSTELQELISNHLLDTEGITAKELGKIIRKGGYSCTKKDINRCLHDAEHLFLKTESDGIAPIWKLK